MATLTSQTTMRSNINELAESSTSNLPERPEVSHGLKNVVGWIKQASIEVREAGRKAVNHINSNIPSSNPTSNLSIDKNLLKSSHVMDTISNLDKNNLTILHFNDVYNVDSHGTQEPVGGAARFCTAIKSFKDYNPLVLFSGDAFSPSMLSSFTKGEQMVPVLNAVGTQCAVFGNHDFDHGLDVLMQHTEKTEFPWLMSNVVDNETGRPLGGGKISHLLIYDSLRIGLIGLVEKEWLETLPTIDPREVTFIDFIKVGQDLAKSLLDEGCDIIIALTHMRTPNDIELANKCPNIDLILGGHDHVCEMKIINGIPIIKSGTDFRQFSRITVNPERNSESKVSIEVNVVDVTSEFEEDVEIKDILDKYQGTIDSKMNEVLGNFTVELDGRFSQIRTAETNLGDWVCDVIMAATGADVVMINSGTFRSDRVHPPGPFSMRDLTNIVPMRDPLIVISVTGKILHEALENSVSGYPKLEGRFPQVSGVTFAFDPRKPVGNRVDYRLVQIGDEWLKLNQSYSLCIKSYMHGGCDGFTMFKNCKMIMDEDTCPEIGLAIQNHFKAIDVRMGKRKHSKHRQSLVSLSRRHSLVQMTDNLEIDGPSPIRRISLSNSMKSTTECGTNNSAKLLRRASLEDMEQVSCQLAPEVQHRIIQIMNQGHFDQLLRQRETLERNTIIREDDELNT